ncbi:FAD-dependent oxidoreductase [Oceanithermus sp.]|uniref:NAD(P)/FAD-dependent oxidoreductase n=1 Tax=Oceanithermus sp. TaxID=2268145 RepID=UPI00257A154C|nr:FAD-dependent oxidoreductase [Oceanithermus sp.]
MRKKVLILGGGSGGVITANKLVEVLGNQVEVTVVDRNAEHTFIAAYPWVAFGLREIEQIRRPLVALQKKGIHFLQAEVQELQPDRNAVQTDRGELAYDYLVVSLGAEPLAYPVEGAQAPWSEEGALALRAWLKESKGERWVVGVSSPFYPCPPAPFEVAGQLDFALRVKGLRSRSSIAIFHVNPAPLAGMGPVISHAISKILDRKGVEFHGSFELVEGGDGVVKAADGRTLEYDRLILVPPFAPNKVVRESPLAGPNGFPEVSPETFRSLQYENIFVIGDTVNPGLNLPPAGVVVHYQGEYVAGVIAADLRGAYIGEPFNPVAMCIMDFGDDAVLPECDFSDMLAGRGMPSCGVMASGRSVRIAKMLFESMFFATLF